MKIQLTKEESEEYFYNALCNGLGELSHYGLDLRYSKEEYTQAKEMLQARNPQNLICYEDVLMEMLRLDKGLYILDAEDDSVYDLTLDKVHERVQNTPYGHLIDMINEQDDAITADSILQTVIYGEVIFA